jgi:hypothetical protein
MGRSVETRRSRLLVRQHSDTGHDVEVRDVRAELLDYVGHDVLLPLDC